MDASALPIPTLLAPAVLALGVGVFGFDKEFNGDPYVKAPMPDEIRQEILDNSSKMEKHLEENRHARIFFLDNRGLNFSINDTIHEDGSVERSYRYDMGSQVQREIYEKTAEFYIATPYGEVATLPLGGSVEHQGLSISDLTTCEKSICTYHIAIETSLDPKTGLYEYDARTSNGEVMHHNATSAGIGAIKKARMLESVAMDIIVEKNENNTMFTIDNHLTDHYLMEIEAKNNNKTLNETGIFSSDLVQSVVIPHEGFDSLTVYAAEMITSNLESMYRRSYTFTF